MRELYKRNMKMRIKSILNEQKQQNAKYDPLINGVTSLVWETLIEMHGKPIAESVHAENIHGLQTLVFQTAMNMDDKQVKRLLETLQTPSNEILASGLEVRALKEGTNFETTTLYKMMFEGINDADENDGMLLKTAKFVNRTKEKAMGAVGNAVKGAVKAVADTSIGKAVIKTVKEIASWVSKKLDILGKFVRSKMQPIIDWLKKKGEEETAMCGIPSKMNSSLLYTGNALNEADGEVKPQISSGPYDLNKLMTLISDPNNQSAIDSFSFAGAKPEATKVAKAIAMMKSQGVVVKGKDFKEILSTVSKVSPDGFMSQWYADNNMGDLIASAEGKPLPSMVAGAGGAMCDFSFDTMKVTNDKMMSDMRNLNSPEFKASWGKVMLDYAGKNKVSTFLTLAGIATSLLMSPVGVVRVASMVFASIAPFIINARIEHLKSINAPEKQVKFWENCLVMSKFIANVLAIFNIGSWLSKGWAGVTESLNDIPDDAVVDEAADQALVSQADSAAEVMMPPISELDQTALQRGIALFGEDGMQKFNGTLSDEQFTKLQDILNIQNKIGAGLKVGVLVSPDAQKAMIEEFVMSDKYSQYSPDQLNSVLNNIQAGKFSMTAFNGLSDASKDALFTANGEIRDEIWDELTKAEKTAKAAAAALKDTTGTPSTEITIGNNVTINGNSGTIEQIATIDDGTKLYKLNNNGTVKWIPAENTPNAVSAANVENKFLDEIKKSTDVIKQLPDSAARQAILNKINSSPALASTLAEPAEAEAMSAMSKEQMDGFAKSLTTSKSPLKPTDIIKFNITNPVKAVENFVSIRNAFPGATRTGMLKFMEVNGMNLGEVHIEKDSITDTIKFTQGDKVLEFPAKDIADAKPTLSA